MYTRYRTKYGTTTAGARSAPRRSGIPLPTDPSQRPGRLALSRARILTTAVQVADANGLGALTMRSLATALGVGPMAIYHHVANKELLLDGIVDLVFAEIDQPSPEAPWRIGLRSRSVSVRAVLGRHPWAVGLMESRRSPGPATLGHHDAVIALLRHAGFTYSAIAHAAAVLDAFVYGFVLQEVSLPFDGPADVPDLAEAILEEIPVGQFPSFVEFAREHVLKPGYDFGDEFEIGLAMVLDGIGRLDGASGSPTP